MKKSKHKYFVYAIRTVCTEDDFKHLVSKGFVICFDNGVIVITHWNAHNTIQKDRYSKTMYQEEYSKLKTENKTYSLPFDNKSYTECIQTVSDMDTQIRLDKIRLDKNRDSSSTPVDAQPLFDYQSVIDTFNSVCVSLPKAKALNDNEPRCHTL